MPVNACCCGGTPITDACQPGCTNRFATINLIEGTSAGAAITQGASQFDDVYAAVAFAIFGSIVSTWNCGDDECFGPGAGDVTMQRSLTDPTVWEMTYVGQSLPSFQTDPGWPLCPPFDDYNQGRTFWHYIPGRYIPAGSDPFVTAVTRSMPTVGTYVTTGTLTVTNVIGVSTLDSSVTAVGTTAGPYPVWDGSLEYDPGTGLWLPAFIDGFGRDRAVALADGLWYRPDLEFGTPTQPTLQMGVLACGTYSPQFLFFDVHALRGMRSPYGSLPLLSNSVVVAGRYVVGFGP